jgi:hypothetical protein
MARWLRFLLLLLLLPALVLLILRGGAADVDATALTDAAAVREALKSRPLDGASYRRLAELEAKDADPTLVAALYDIAARRAPRDRPSHAWLADHHALRGETSRALFHVDQLMRLTPARAHDLFPALGTLLATPDSRAALVDFLAQAQHPWRPAFLRWIAGQPAVSPLLGSVFDPLRTAAAPLSDEERGYWLDRLMRDGRSAEAYYLWIDALPPERRASIGNLYDGGFENEASLLGRFDWELSAVPGATITRAQTNGTQGRHSLSIEFHDRRVPFDHVRQRLAIPAGDYLLDGRVRIDDLRNERGLRWELRCGEALLAASEPFSGSSAWRSFDVPFTVPAQPCAGLMLRLRLDARIRPEQMIGGRLWFDDLRIRRRD